jgi:hypothetical protein
MMQFFRKKIANVEAKIAVAAPGPNTDAERMNWCRVFMMRWTPEPKQFQVDNFKFLCDNGFFVHTLKGTMVKRFAHRYLEIKLALILNMATHDFKEYVEQHELIAANAVDLEVVK